MRSAGLISPVAARISGCVLLLILATTPFPVRAKVVELPTPHDVYRVGTAVLDLTDIEREELWTEAPGDHRRLVVQLWYPTLDAGSGPRAPYVVRGDRMRSTLNHYLKDVSEVRTAAMLNASPPIGKGRFPLIVFSHGMNSARFFYTALLEALASHGYVVAAIDHSYWSIGEVFESGDSIPFIDCMVARDQLTSDEIDRMMAEGIGVMAADEAFVARSLLAGHLPGMAGVIAARIDSTRVGCLGHSMGGMAAQAACLTYSCFRGCMSLDGAVWNPVHVGLQPTACEKPLALVVSQQFFAPDSAFARQYLSIWKDPLVLLLRGARHNSFTDFPLLERQPAGNPDPLETFAEVSRLAKAFFDATWTRQGRASRTDVYASPRVEVLELESMLK